MRRRERAREKERERERETICVNSLVNAGHFLIRP